MKNPGKLLIAVLGSILGISVVSCGGGGENPAPVYGTPTATYQLSGKVMNVDAVAIPAISVSFQNHTVSSAADGTWSLDIQASSCNNACTLYASDVDIAANGSYADRSVPVVPTLVSPGSGGLNLGVFQLENINITLEIAPTATYRLNGTVVDSSTAAPVPGIALTFRGITTRSAADGTWSMDIHAPSCENTCSISIDDTDGTSNGSYPNLNMPLTFLQVSSGSGGGLDQGVFQLENLNIAMTKRP